MLYLWLVPCCLVFLACLLAASYKEKWAVGVACKTLASLCFSALGVLGQTKAIDTHYAAWIATGLVFGFVADIVINLRYALPKQKNRLFMGGMLLFLLGHLSYIVAIYPRTPLIPLSFAFAVGLTAALMRWIFAHIEAPKTIKMAGSVYLGTVVFLCCMSASAVAHAPSVGRMSFALGACLFLASDVIHTLNNFGPDQHFSSRVINLSLYYAAQLLIALSVQLAT